MDNTRTIPGYKYYVDPVTGERPECFVTFLNIVPDRHAAVNGVLFEASRGLLEQLDERERNYERIDVSSEACGDAEGTVWAYVGSQAATRRFELGFGRGLAVVSSDYYERVREDFRSFGPDSLREYTELTDAPPCPILALRRVDLPASASGSPSVEPRDRGRRPNGCDTPPR